MQKRCPKQLSYGANNAVIALNEKEAAKNLFVRIPKYRNWKFLNSSCC